MNIPNRIYSLDIMRGVAALCVVFWHWQHFHALSLDPHIMPAAELITRERQPFYGVLKILYNRGYMAVDLFFLNSGFIFFWLYEARIREKLVSVSQFSILRFTRLYPLHLFCLVLVAALQAIFIYREGSPFVYEGNTVFAFVKNLLFIQGQGQHASFNGPEWSLTIEIIMYALFAVLAIAGLLRGVWVSAFLLVVGLLVARLDEGLGRGLAGFFCGGLVFKAFRWLLSSEKRRILTFCLACAALAGWLIVFLSVYTNTFSMIIAANGRAYAKIVIFAFSQAVIYILMPITILSCVLYEAMNGAGGMRRWSWVGDLSYSSYLIHFPLQIVAALLITYFYPGINIVESRFIIALYMLILVILSLLSHRMLEMPAQNWLRRRLAQAKLGASDAATKSNINLR